VGEGDREREKERERERDRERERERETEPEQQGERKNEERYCAKQNIPITPFFHPPVPPPSFPPYHSCLVPSYIFVLSLFLLLPSSSFAPFLSSLLFSSLMLAICVQILYIFVKIVDAINQ